MIGSYSFFRDFENCPRKAWHKFVERDLPRDDTDATRWGNRVHKALAERIGGDDWGNYPPLPPEVEQYEPYAATLERRAAGIPMFTEYKLGMREDGTHCGFFDADCWVRGVLDTVILDVPLAWIGDWKTGKIREDAFELEVGAMLLKARYPDLRKISGNYIWLKPGQIGQRHDLSHTDATLDTVRRMMETVGQLGDSEWSPRPNPLCGWCPVLSCEHNKVKQRCAS